jgi:Transposase DDE domain
MMGTVISCGLHLNRPRAAVLTELDSTPAPSPEVATTSKTQRICQTDPDASLGKGGRLPRVEPAYKQQTAVDTKQGVILDVEVTTGRVHDSNTLSALDEVPRVTGRSITIVTLDAGYGVARVFAELEARRIEAIVPTRREPSPKKGVIPARRFKLDARHDRLRCPRGRHLMPHSKPNAEGFKVYRSSIRDCRPCPLRAACFSPNAQRRTVLLNKDHPALLRARRRHLAWTERERILYASHHARVEGVHGEEKAWHGLAWAVRRSRQHENPSLPNRRSRKPEEIGRRGRRALTHAVAHSQTVSIVHGGLIGSAFATAPIVCLTLAKWETVSGRFGGYLIKHFPSIYKNAASARWFQSARRPYSTPTKNPNAADATRANRIQHRRGHGARSDTDTCCPRIAGREGARCRCCPSLYVPNLSTNQWPARLA